MPIPPADRRERENVDAFLCGLKASAYQAPLRNGENLRSEGADSQILTGSQSLPTDASECRETSKGQILTVSQDDTEQVITEMVEDLAQDVDFAIGYGSNLPFTGAELRQYYADLMQRVLGRGGARRREAALAGAGDRRRVAVGCSRTRSPRLSGMTATSCAAPRQVTKGAGDGRL